MKNKDDEYYRRWASDCLKKKRYDSEAHAKDVRRKIFKTRGVKTRFYHCHFCGGVHLTSNLTPINQTK